MNLGFIGISLAGRLSFRVIISYDKVAFFVFGYKFGMRYIRGGSTRRTTRTPKLWDTRQPRGHTWYTAATAEHCGGSPGRLGAHRGGDISFHFRRGVEQSPPRSLRRDRLALTRRGSTDLPRAGEEAHFSRGGRTGSRRRRN